MNINSLDRRRFLSGTGVALALPLFESQTGVVARAAGDAAHPKRLACFYFPDGVPMPLRSVGGAEGAGRDAARPRGGCSMCACGGASGGRPSGGGSGWATGSVGAVRRPELRWE